MSTDRITKRDTRRIRARFLWTIPAAVMALAGLRPATASPATPTDCQPLYTNGPLFITPFCVDPGISQPHIDTVQPGSVTDPATGVTVKYIFVHGSFGVGGTKFAYYFPVKNAYRGWFIEGTYPTVGQEGTNPPLANPSDSSLVDAATVAFAISHGAYVVSSNNAGGVPAGGALAPYRANAAAAKFSRLVADHIYGTTTPARGFIFGASGGAYQTLAAAEFTRGVWQGTVPMVPGPPNAIPSFQTSQLLALRLLAPVLPQIASAEEVGGSGNPFAGLNIGQQHALLEVTRMGFPLRGWWQYATLNGGAFLAVEAGVQAIDPTYASDFWSLPNYEGAAPAVKAARIQATETVEGLSGTTGIILNNVPAGDLLNADLTVTSGSQSGSTFKIISVSGNTITIATLDGALAGNTTGATNTGIAPGDTVTLDNSWVIALQYYQRHQVPSDGEYGWNQYLNTSGQPRFPQRPILVGPILDAGASGAVSDGKFYGKMIMLGSAMDVQAYPWSADWYMHQFETTMGPSFAQSYRLWYMDNADHDPPGPAQENYPNAADHIVSYIDEYEQALLYLNRWVAIGDAPPASTGFTLSNLDQVELAPKAVDRLGVQPMVFMTAGGSSLVNVTAGQSVTFDVKGQEPPGAGNIVDVQWDLQGSGTFSPITPVPTPGTRVTLTSSATYNTPGTYFATVRILSAMKGANPSSPYALVQNIASVRVVVH